VKISIICIVENTASGDLLGEHGLSFLVETERNRILFDTGAGHVFAHNASKLRISQKSIDSLVLSHGHYDHTGGIKDALPYLKENAKIYFHPAALEPKYSHRPDGFAYIGISEENKRLLMELKGEKIPLRNSHEIAEGIWTSGEVERNCQEEVSGSKFFLDPEGTREDLLIDDLSLFIRTEKGLLVLGGCCHSGPVNTMEQAVRQFPSEGILGFIGGTHLVDADEKRVLSTSDYFSSHGLELIAPCHCTGEIAKAMLFCENRNAYCFCSTGSLFRF